MTPSAGPLKRKKKKTIEKSSKTDRQASEWVTEQVREDTLLLPLITHSYYCIRNEIGDYH